MHAAPRTNLQKRTSLNVESSYRGAEEHTSYTHLIQGDLAPVGRVHLVSIGQSEDQRENHILTEMDADANMGAQRLKERSRRGPFKTSSGRSRVLDRSAHVSYRRRGAALEITVQRGATEYELDTLFGKLGAHRLATIGSVIYIIKGGRKKKIGKLDRVDLDKLREKVEECLDKYSSAGLLVQDTEHRGALHKSYLHGMRFKENLRQLAPKRVLPS